MYTLLGEEFGKLGGAIAGSESGCEGSLLKVASLARIWVEQKVRQGRL